MADTTSGTAAGAGPHGTPPALAQVDEALARYAQAIDGAVDAVLDQQVTDYPVLVWQRGGAALELGVILLAEANPGAWELRVTTLEEMVGKNLMRPERVADFKRVFADARRQYCCFVVTGEGANFAFRPRG